MSDYTAKGSHNGIAYRLTAFPAQEPALQARLRTLDPTF